MGLETLIFIGISAGLSYLSAKLMQKTQSSKVKAEQATLTTRGSYTNFLRGRRRVGPLFAWAGKRTSSKHDDVRYYYEKGWHVLAVGPCTRLTKIWKDGKVLWDEGIDSTTTPSGSYVTIGKRKIRGFWIYWGENDQPVDSNLAEWLGIESAWPKTTYVILNGVELTTGRWPDFQYEIECFGITPEGTDGLQNSTRINTDYTMNPAHVIWEYSYQDYPDGCGISFDNLDKDLFEEVGTILENEGTWCSVLSNDGRDLTELIADLLEDFGLMLCQRGNKIGLIAVRSTEYALVLDANQLMPPLPELEFNLIERGKNKIIYKYSDYENNYTETDVKVDNDGTSTKIRPNIDTVELATIISRDTANRVSERKSQEQLVGPIKYKLSVNRAGRSLRAGDSIYISDIGKMRVTSYSLDTMSARTEIEVVVDLYGLELSGYLNGIITGGIDGDGAYLRDDIAFTALEMYREADDYHYKEIIVLRIRRELSSGFANVLVSFDDGTSYETIAETNDLCSGGRLLQGIEETDNFIIEEGPIIYVANTDIENVEDLSTDPISWHSGKQLCFINNEVFYLQKVTAISSTQYRLDGLIRARFDTIREEHSIGDYAFIILKEDLTPIQDNRFNSGQEILVKAQPKTDEAVLEEDGIVPKQLTTVVRGWNPLSPKNVRVNSSILYEPSQDFTITWSIRKMVGSEYHTAMSGRQISGTIVEDTSAPRDGYFRVEVRETWGYTRLSYDVDSDTYQKIVTWSDVEDAFGQVPDELDIAVINISGKNESLAGIQRIRKEKS